MRFFSFFVSLFHVFSNFYLWTKWCFFMKIAIDEITKLACCYPTFTINTNTAWVPDYLQINSNHIYICYFSFVSCPKTFIQLLLFIMIKLLIVNIYVFTSQTICSAVWSLYRNRWENELVLRHIGHLVISSGHSYGAIEAGASQYFGSNPQTEPDIRPPGPDSPGDHFFQVEIDFYGPKFIVFLENIHNFPIFIFQNLPLAKDPVPNNPPVNFEHNPNHRFVCNKPFHVLVALSWPSHLIFLNHGAYKPQIWPPNGPNHHLVDQSKCCVALDVELVANLSLLPILDHFSFPFQCQLGQSHNK